MKTICFVGISDKENKQPFDSSTKSGAIVDQIIQGLSFSCIKMNYVSFVPKDKKGKLRYPTKEELSHSFFDFQEKIKRINPDLIVVCGTIIQKELKKKNWNFCPSLFIYHPSYILIYKRNCLNSYINETIKKVNSYFEIGDDYEKGIIKSSRKL